MTKRILWKKGMRLTEDIFIQSDKCMSETVSSALLLGSIGRMGLFPKFRPFRLSLDISKDIVEVVSIDCLGLTRDGSLIDVSYDTNYTNIFDTRVTIPGRGTEVRYLLCIVIKDEWRDTNDGLCEPKYEFQLLEENSPVPANALPIARILYDEYRWCADEINFVPPCLYVTSHEKYDDLSSIFLQTLTELNRMLPEKFITEEKDALKIFWPTVQQLMITMDKEREQLTPMSLLANVQKFISSFVCACTIDEYITIGEPEQYYAYINTPYNYKNAYNTIKEGLELCLSIKKKVEDFDVPEPSPSPVAILSPTIEKAQLQQYVKCGIARFKITNNVPGSTVYYTTDGSMPTQSSRSGSVIEIESGFADNWHHEPRKKATIKLIAYKDGKSSKVETFEVEIIKGNPFSGPII